MWPELHDIPQLLEQAVALHRSRQLAEAENRYLQILNAQPDHFDSLHLLGVLRHQRCRNEEALRLIEAALKTRPNSVEALSNYGTVLDALGRHDAALASYERALAINPNDADTLFNYGNTLKDLRRHPLALAAYEQALTARPDFPEALFNCGNVLTELKRPLDALVSYDRALALRPNYVKALFNRGNVLIDLKRPNDARESFHRVIALDPSHPLAFGQLAGIAIECCDFAATAEFARQLETKVAGRSIFHPFLLIRYCDDEALHLAATQHYLRHTFPAPPEQFRHHKPRPHKTIRLGYLSADFRRHPVASLIVQMIELHDRSQFEVIGFSLGHDDGSDIRQRTTKAFDTFHDLRHQPDDTAANLVVKNEIDVLVDLTGHTQDAREGILARRPAPIQVNYLGYPGTFGADYIDYIIADAITLPFDRQPLYTENIVHLPDCFQPNDTKRAISGRKLSRADVGLPEQGFVFCSFNNQYKITASVFDTWMRLLRTVERSVLWLSQGNDAAHANLRREAVDRGVDSDRLIFAPRLERHEDHLARQRLADLFLDTLPYNAHTTASEALWAGLPVLTARGASFAGRVAASLNVAVGLPELVTESLADYEALALRLARDPSEMLKMREKLARNLPTCPLFDTPRLCGHIEQAYKTMWERWQRHEAPRSFAVEP